MHTANVNKFMGMSLEQLEKDETERPKFADVYSLKEPPVVRKSLKHLREWNAEGPFQADVLLYQRVAEATEANLKNDKEENLEKLARCGAVIFRMMEFVQSE